jgi:hypothetical protein
LQLAAKHTWFEQSGQRKYKAAARNISPAAADPAEGHLSGLLALVVVAADVVRVKADQVAQAVRHEHRPCTTSAREGAALQRVADCEQTHQLRPSAARQECPSAGWPAQSAASFKEQRNDTLPKHLQQMLENDALSLAMHRVPLNAWHSLKHNTVNVEIEKKETAPGLILPNTAACAATTACKTGGKR